MECFSRSLLEDAEKGSVAVLPYEGVGAEAVGFALPRIVTLSLLSRVISSQ